MLSSFTTAVEAVAIFSMLKEIYQLFIYLKKVLYDVMLQKYEEELLL